MINFFIIYSLLSLVVLLGVSLVAYGLLRNAGEPAGDDDSDSGRDSQTEVEPMLDLGSTGLSHYNDRNDLGTAPERFSGFIRHTRKIWRRLTVGFPSRLKCMLLNAWLRLKTALRFRRKRSEPMLSGPRPETEPNRCSTPIGGIVKWPCGPLQSFTTFSDQRKSKVKVEY